MKRLIKFRGKRTDTGEWVFGDLIHGVGSKHGRMYILPVTNIYPKGCNELDGWEVIPDSIGQLIGIIPNTSMYVDNQQELYEGDLFTCGNSKTVYQTVYDGCGEYYGISNEGDKYGPYTVRLSRSNIKNQNIKVVGNIHDNPELLEGGKE